MNNHSLIAILFLLTCAHAQPRPATLIETARVLDGRPYLTHQGILIENDRIKELGDFTTVRQHAPKDAIAIDLRNATVLPGLIDRLASMSPRAPGDALTLAIAQMSLST